MARYQTPPPPPLYAILRTLFLGLRNAMLDILGSFIYFFSVSLLTCIKVYNRGLTGFPICNKTGGEAKGDCANR